MLRSHVSVHLDLFPKPLQDPNNIAIGCSCIIEWENKAEKLKWGGARCALGYDQVFVL